MHPPTDNQESPPVERNDMRRPYRMNVHQVVRDKISGPALDRIARTVLMLVDTILSTDTDMVKQSMHSIHQAKDGQEFTVKLVVARGRDEDVVTLTVPKPLHGELVECEDCHQVGYTDFKTKEVCPTCNGLGHLEITQGSL